MQKGFGGDYIVQDDARQHVFWMQRFLDPELFPNDLIADYYQSVAPVGYANLYKFMTWLGIDPFIFNKILPTILGVITAGYCFGVCLEILPIPTSAFIASTLLSQNLWLHDTVISGKAASFMHPLLMAFLYYLIRKKILAVTFVILLFGLFYPTYILVCSGLLILSLLSWKKGRLTFSKSPQDYLLCFIGLGVAFVVLLPYALKTSDFAPIVTAAEARQLPEFQAGARASFFHDNDPWRFWFNASRTGIRITSALIPKLVYGGLLFPILLQFPKRFPLVKLINPKVRVLLDLTITGLTLFFLAHALLFKLYIPSRYTQHTLRFVLIIAAGITLIILLDALFQWAKTVNLRKLIVIGVATFLGINLCFHSWLNDNFPHTGYLTGQYPALYEFFAMQPKDSMIASLDVEANYIPSFSGRSILVSSEYAIPYHLGYYNQIRQRAFDLINAQYSLNFNEVREFIKTYNIDFWLLRQSALNAEYLANSSWIRQYQPATQNAIKSLELKHKSIVFNAVDSCSIFNDKDLTVLATNCILTAKDE